jgi:hypothetical protein
MPACRAKGVTKAVLYAALGASARRALTALLHHRLAFIGAPGHRQARGRRCSRAHAPARRGAQRTAHRGSSTAPGQPGRFACGLPSARGGPAAESVSGGGASDLCAADTRCDIFSGPFFRAFNATPDYDMFLGIQGQTGTAPAAACGVVTGGGNFPNTNTKWLTCSNDLNGPGDDCGDLGPCYFLDTYQLPPDQIHKACLNNPACFGFRVSNDRQSGSILGRRTTPSSNEERYGYFKIL